MTDWTRTRIFYESGLGFTVDWTHQFRPGLPVFAQLTRDGMSIFLTEHRDDCEVGGAVYFLVDDVDALYAEVQSHGISALEPPTDAEWNAREMTIVDPDGNKLRFSTPVSTRST